MLLSQMKENDVGFIDKINGDCGFERRFFDMGFVKGQRVECSNIGICGTPIAYRICDSKIAVRKKDAALIGVVM